MGDRNITTAGKTGRRAPANLSRWGKEREGGGHGGIKTIEDCDCGKGLRVVRLWV